MLKSRCRARARTDEWAAELRLREGAEDVSDLRRVGSMHDGGEGEPTLDGAIAADCKAIEATLRNSNSPESVSRTNVLTQVHRLQLARRGD